MFSHDTSEVQSAKSTGAFSAALDNKLIQQINQIIKKQMIDTLLGGWHHLYKLQQNKNSNVLQCEKCYSGG